MEIWTVSNNRSSLLRAVKQLLVSANFNFFLRSDTAGILLYSVFCSIWGCRVFSTKGDWLIQSHDCNQPYMFCRNHPGTGRWKAAFCVMVAFNYHSVPHFASIARLPRDIGTFILIFAAKKTSHHHFLVLREIVTMCSYNYSKITGCPMKCILTKVWILSDQSHRHI